MAPSVCTELMNVSFWWMGNPSVSICKSSLENIAYQLHFEYCSACLVNEEKYIIRTEWLKKLFFYVTLTYIYIMHVCIYVCVCVCIYCDAKLTKIPKTGLYFRTCEDGAGWHLIPYRISPRSEFFSQAYKNWHITWGINLEPDWLPLAKGSKFHTITHPPGR